jgi:hypothetical protein
MIAPAVEFHLPIRPYGVIDAYNRKAAAVGSPRYAQATEYANYNGHHVTLSWNDYRRYYVAEYFWAGRVVIARGDFAYCLRAAIEEYNRGALGASASICPRADDLEAVKLCEDDTRIGKGSLWTGDGCEKSLTRGEWWTWRHQVAVACPKDMANPRCPTLIFNWDMLQAAESREAYEAALRERYGRVYQ